MFISRVYHHNQTVRRVFALGPFLSHVNTRTLAIAMFAALALLSTDQTFSHTFVATGTYSYFCSIHPSMTGKIIVK